MQSGLYRFDRFALDRGERRLCRDGEALELNGRYFDALALLVGNAGSLVTKDRFLTEVWRGVPVTDEALTQCIRVLRGTLGDEAARPRFIETVPKHGYRFIAEVDASASGVLEREPDNGHWRRVGLLAGAGTIGGGLAGLIGGLIYGFAAASEPMAGGLSTLLVVLCLTILVSVIGGAGVSVGISLASARGGGNRMVAGGALGGLVVGALVKLLGLDAFMLIVGQSPRGITGALEGFLLGAAVGGSAWLSAANDRRLALRVRVIAAAGIGAVGGLIVTLAGGRLMAGSLDLLAATFPNSRLRLDQISMLFGEHGFGPISRGITSMLEGALFAGCVISALGLARRQIEAQR